MLPHWLYALWPLALLAVCLSESDTAMRLSVRRRVVLAAIGGAGLLCLLAVLYLGAPSRDPQVVRGMVHGRYFIPLAPLLLLAIPGLRLLEGRRLARAAPVAITALCTSTLAIAAYAVATHYFAGLSPI